jgi:Cys-tRNA(Pro)/Cys-tRNA(Cys) deacylase
VATAKTNAVRLLERLGIPCELRAYEVDPDDLAAETVARKVGLPPEQVFKTLVARGDKHGVCLAIVPGHCELDLKALARATGDKKIDTVPLKEVEPLTGYIRGGVTALACKKPYPVYLDETAQLFDGSRSRRASGASRSSSPPTTTSGWSRPRSSRSPRTRSSRRAYDGGCPKQ